MSHQRSDPPGLPFHLAIALPTAGLVYAASTPGLELLLLMASLIGLGTGAVVWLIRAATWTFASQRPRVGGRAAWFAVAPVCGALVVAALITDLPLRARWSIARDDFTQTLDLVPEMPDGPGDPLAPHAVDDPVPFDVPDRIGTYSVDRATRVRAGVLFHIGGSGIGFSDGGFAHIPGGPPNGLGPHGPTPTFGNAWFETITFRHLDGDWYVWDAVQ